MVRYPILKEKSIKNKNHSKEKETGESTQGGYMPILHSVEKNCYGPKLKMGARSQVFYFIRHNALSWAHQDGVKAVPIPKKEIMEATGLDARRVERILKELEKDEVILVHRSKTGKVWNPNKYELHPNMFGNDFVYRPEKPILTVYSGGKSEKTYPHVPSDIPVDVPSDLPGRYRQIDRVEEGLTTGKQKGIRPLRTIKNKRISLRENNDEKTQSKEDFIKKISDKFDVSVKEVTQVWNQWAHQDNDCLGRPIINLGKLLLSSFTEMRKAIKNPYEGPSCASKEVSNDDDMHHSVGMPEHLKEELMRKGLLRSTPSGIH